MSMWIRDTLVRMAAKSSSEGKTEFKAWCEHQLDQDSGRLLNGRYLYRNDREVTAPQEATLFSRP